MGLMNYAEAAEWLGVPQKWLETKVQRGKVPHTRLGKHVRFSEEHLQAIVKAGEPKLGTAMPTASQAAVLRPASGRSRRART